MKKTMFGLLCLALLGGVSFADVYTAPVSDERAYAEKMYIGTMGTLRYVGGPVDGFITSGFVPYYAGSQAAAYQFFETYSPESVENVEISCPRVNGVPMCA